MAGAAAGRARSDGRAGRAAESTRDYLGLLEATRDHPRVPESTREHPRVPEIVRDCPRLSETPRRGSSDSLLASCELVVNSL